MVCTVEMDPDFVRIRAYKAGLPEDFIIKEFYLSDLLRQLVSREFADALIFKGGTALNRVYLSGSMRFSEDLDFDIVHAEDNLTRRIMKEVTGFDSVEEWRFRNVRRIEFTYKKRRGKDRVRIDINFGFGGKTLEKPVVADVRSGFINDVVRGVATYGLEDLLARKLNALADRSEGKDIFDSYNGLAIADMRKLKRALPLAFEGAAKGTTVKGFARSADSKLERIDAKKVRDLTNPYIPIRNRPTDWRIMIDTLRSRIKAISEA